MTNVSLVTSTTSTQEKVCAFSYWTIYIYNGINDSFTVHVQSADDDLGNRTLPFNGSTDWGFCMGITFKTRFYAHFYWNSKTAFFDVFDYTTSNHHCSERKIFKQQRCVWLVRDDGFYLSSQLSPFPIGWTKLHEWS
ncbi:unnamed protein product [Lactuca saligna]|uniref:S-protein homolog n=1 Tax=Lactuca saligna TaxID=75948 RepID=A0AA36DW76_LACSI|nr:unnamed protein product [Lactuca saligna]